MYNPLCNLALDFSNIGSLRPLRSLHNLELDHVSFLQSAITFTNNRGIVNENIRAIVAPDEAIPFRVIEPLHGATQFRSLPKTDVFLRGYWPNASQADSDGIEPSFLSRVVEICLV